MKTLVLTLILAIIALISSLSHGQEIYEVQPGDTFPGILVKKYSMPKEVAVEQSFYVWQCCKMETHHSELMQEAPHTIQDFARGPNYLQVGKKIVLPHSFVIFDKRKVTPIKPVKDQPALKRAHETKPDNKPFRRIAGPVLV